MDDISLDSPSVQTYLTILQGVINRMASNSAACKTWCIALVSATLVIVANTTKAEYALIAILPAVIFFMLDVYYLALEKTFRDLYNSFIKKLHESKAISSDLYVISTKVDFPKFKGALSSLSTWPFYLTLIVMIVVVRYTIIG